MVRTVSPRATGPRGRVPAIPGPRRAVRRRELPRRPRGRAGLDREVRGLLSELVGPVGRHSAYPQVPGVARHVRRGPAGPEPLLGVWWHVRPAAFGSER